MEQQGLDLSSCLKQLKKRQNILKTLDTKQQRTVTHEKREKDKVSPLIVQAHCLEFPKGGGTKVEYSLN